MQPSSPLRPLAATLRARCAKWWPRGESLGGVVRFNRAAGQGRRCGLTGGLIGLVERLEQPGAIGPCGVARARVLASDGMGPLYNPASSTPLVRRSRGSPRDWICPRQMKPGVRCERPALDHPLARSCAQTARRLPLQLIIRRAEGDTMFQFTKRTLIAGVVAAAMTTPPVAYARINLDPQAPTASGQASSTNVPQISWRPSVLERVRLGRRRDRSGGHRRVDGCRHGDGRRSPPTAPRRSHELTGRIIEKASRAGGVFANTSPVPAAAQRR